MVLSNKRLLESAKRLSSQRKFPKYDSSLKYTQALIDKLIRNNQRLQQINYLSRNGEYEKREIALHIIKNNLEDRCEPIRAMWEREERNVEKIFENKKMRIRKIRSYDFLIERIIAKSQPQITKNYLPTKY